MQNLNIPQGYQAVMPYLILHNADTFWDWAINTLGATEKMRSFREDGVTLAHCELQIGGSTIMVSEASAEWPANTAGLFIYVPNVDKVYADAIASGARSLMDLTDRSYGRTCGFEDIWGNVWWPSSPLTLS